VVFNISISELLIISLFFITAMNCALTYFCCVKSLKILEKDKSISKAINRLRILDQYLLSKVNLLVALFYFGISYLFVEHMFPDSEYIFFFSCVLSFPLSLISTFASRVCYCYTCNVLLETKLNELECLILNFKRMIVVYLPFFIISFIVSTVYMFELSYFLSNIICTILLLIVIVLWVLLAPKVMILNYKAKEIEDNSLLKYRLNKLMDKHGIKHYKLYYWDSSRSKESNAMVSGFIKHYLFISSCLIEEVTLPELETIITHEIGHIKNNHLVKLMFGKLFVIGMMILTIVLPFTLEFGYNQKALFYLLAVFIVFVGLIVGVALERRYENQADMYASCYNDPELFESAIRKITKYEEEKKNKIDGLFQSHPNSEDRIKKIKKE